MDLRATDSISEMIEIGKSIILEKKDIYRPEMINTIKATIDGYYVTKWGG